jgi:hypothetical protein
LTRFFLNEEPRTLGGSFLASKDAEGVHPMPTTHHSAAAERHLQAAHFHEAAAASHNQNDHLSAHEQSKRAHEFSLEAHKHSEQAVKLGETQVEIQIEPASASDPTVVAAGGGELIQQTEPLK